MYSLIHTSEENKMTFFDTKRKTISQITPNPVKRTEKHHFLLVSLCNVAISVVTVNLKVSPINLVFLMYFISLVTAYSSFRIFKKNQANELNKYILEDPSHLLNSRALEKKFTKFMPLLKSGILITLLGVIISIVFLYHSQNILLMLLSWLLNSFGIFFMCDPMFYYFVTKRKLKNFIMQKE